jgi:uncharacterized protein
MNKKAIHNRIIRFLKFIYLKMFRINDTPHRVSLGFGLGVFVGILPGTGPLVALILAAVFRINKAAALLGSILTNTWLSFLTIVLSIKIGAGIMHLEWQDLHHQWQILLKDFHWKCLLQYSSLKIVLPVLLGYLVISVTLGCATYLVSLIILQLRKSKK